KYKVIILMLFISLAIYFYTKSEKSEFNIHLTLGLCSVFICVMSFFNYFVLRLYPIYYTLRLSLRSDYNMYSVAILTGLVCLFFCVKKQQINQYAFYFGGFPLCSACVILSGSRRGFLFWVVICIVFFVSDIVPQKGIQSCSLGKHIAVKIGIYAVFVCMTMLIVFFTEKGLYALYDEYGSFVNSQSGVVKIENETSYSQRLGTISKGSFMTKRLVIWKEAVEEIKSFDTKSILFGKGNGYDIYMYSESTNPRLWELYDKDTNKFNLSPHNFILSDILNGGISKAVVSFLLWVFICGELLKLLYYEKSLAFLYIIPLGMVFFGSIISGRYGFLYDKYFYIFITLVLFRHKQKFQTPIDNIKI
ncbi:MAG: O-antigen ligase family protein, partial [Oscillospiraceae bacterium]